MFIAAWVELCKRSSNNDFSQVGGQSLLWNYKWRPKKNMTLFGGESSTFKFCVPWLMDDFTYKNAMHSLANSFCNLFGCLIILLLRWLGQIWIPRCPNLNVKFGRIQNPNSKLTFDQSTIQNLIIRTNFDLKVD